MSNLDRAALDRLVDDAQVITREATIRAAVDVDAREFEAIGVPYGAVIEHMFGKETFDAGSVDAEGAILLYGHRDAIGPILEGADVDAGYKLKARISDTALGRDVWTLMRDGVITKMSIGFVPLEYRVDEAAGVIHWTKVKAREFSLVPIPAYDGAAVDLSTLRQPLDSTTTTQENTNMDPITREDLADLENTLDDHTRSLKLIEAGLEVGHGYPAGAQWRTIGDFLKSLAAGDNDAAEFHRAYTGATTSDTVAKDSFVGDFVKLVDERRKIVNDFTRGTLPTDGMSVDYVKLKADTTQVSKQDDEGDDLAYGKVALESANAPVHTWGGWTELSRQAIERATVPTLNITLRALGLKYAKVTNQAVADALTTAAAAQTTAGADVDLADDTADAWIDAVIDAALAMETAGFDLTRLHVSADVFKELAKLKDGDNRLMNIYGSGVNVAGAMDLRRIEGNLANVSVRLLPAADAGTAVFSDPLAIEFLESAGAPAQLQDENIINLTKQFSIYGYGSILTPFPQAIVPVTMPA